MSQDLPLQESKNKAIHNLRMIIIMISKQYKQDPIIHLPFKIKKGFLLLHLTYPQNLILPSKLYKQKM
jgi:hypothetical protein